MSKQCYVLKTCMLKVAKTEIKLTPTTRHCSTNMILKLFF